MKKLQSLISALAVAAFFYSGAAHAAATGTFTDANREYAAGNFKKAIELYERIIRMSNGTGAVYYNLGSAYLKTGQKGQALLAYRRAERRIPRDQDLRWNLSVVRAALKDHVEDTDENIFLYGIKKALGYVTINEIAIVLTLSLGLLFILTAAEFFMENIKIGTGIIQFILFAVLLLSALVLGMKYRQIKDPPVVVLDPEVTVYYGPSDKESKAFVLHEGAEAKVMDRMADWYYIRLKNKNSGWIAKNSCEIV